MKLTEKPETIIWPKTHYIYIEKIGPFMETAPQAWQTLHRLLPEILKSNKVTAHMSLYKIEPNKMTYRAGVVLTEAPSKLPAELKYSHFEGGKYAKFVLTGSYANLPQACGRVFEIVATQKIPLRDDFNIEHYANDPSTTPEDQLITEILIAQK